MSDARSASSGTSWRKILTEGLAVVLSILLAFSIDAWWDGLQERRDEEQILQSLRVEFEANGANLPGRIQQHERTAAAAEAIVGSLRAVTLDEMVAVPDSLLMWSMLSGSFDPASGTLQAVLESGDLRLIRSDHLKGMLAAWPSRVDDAREDEVALRELFQTRHLDILAREVDVGEVLDQFRQLRTTGRVEETGHHEVRATTDLLSALAWVKFVAQEAANGQQRLVTYADSIIAEIDDELGR